MVTDSINGRMILFAGMNTGMPGGQYLNDIWALDADEETWHLIEPLGQAPPPRFEAAAAYHSLGSQMIVFGGRAGETYYNDVWSLDLTPGSETWTQLFPSGTPPSPRTCAKAVIDPINNRMVFFGGSTATNGFNETWSLDLSTLTWSLLSPSGTIPDARFAHCAIYEPNGHRMVIFGGVNWYHPMMDDTWSLDLTYGSESWQQLFPAGQQPGARTQHFCIHDQCNNDMVIGFGYTTDPTWLYYNDVWALDFGSLAWTRILEQTITVEGRRASCAAYDPVAHKFFIFGGNQYNSFHFGDTYVVTLDSVGVAEYERNDAAGHAYIKILGNPTRFPCRFNVFVPVPGSALLRILDAAGRSVDVLTQGEHTSGNHIVNWAGVDSRGRKVPAGTYFVVLEMNGEVITQKSVLIK